METTNVKKCPDCGGSVNATGICPNCSVKKISFSQDEKEKRWQLSVIFAIFFGSLGVHRFYNGHILTGILMIVTVGGCGIWTIIDIITLVTGGFKDKDGNPVSYK